MQVSIIQRAPRMRSLLPYALVFLACFATIVLPTILAMRGPDGSFEPANLTARLDAMPRWLHGGLIVVMLAFVAVEFDFIGRLLAFPIARLAFARTVTRRRLTAIRFAILSVLLAWTVFNIVFGSWPAPHGWARPAFFGVLFVPIILSVVEWMLSGEAPRHDLGKN